LNRREEAEHHWLQSVKLRPSYFEAVEHLIGLLCGDHRGNEAVNIIEFVERSLRLPKPEEAQDYFSETSSNTDRDSCDSLGTASELIAFDYDDDSDRMFRSPSARDTDDGSQPGFGSSGFSIPGSENGRILALVHAKGNMLYALGDVDGASKAFEDAVLISAGRGLNGIQGLIRRIVNVLSLDGINPLRSNFRSPPQTTTSSPLLLPPDKALQTARLVFAKNGDLPGLRHVPDGLARRAAVSTTSNSLLSLAKIFQDAMSNNSSRQRISRMPTGVGDILALYYLSLSLQPSPSTANNVGILLASVQQPPAHRTILQRDSSTHPTIPGVVPGSGVALALAYYNYGLNLDSRHAHIYTNLGSLLKDIGQLAAAITMYEKAVACDNSFDIALANLANAVKDQGRTSDAIEYYRRAVASSPDFAEAVCGLANALNSVCDWAGRGGVILDGGRHDRWHVDETGMITDARANGNGSGWMKRVVDIVSKQLKDGSVWGRGTLQDETLNQVLHQLEAADSGGRWPSEKRVSMRSTLTSWAGHRWEGARIIRLIERSIKRAMHRWYIDRHVKQRQLPPSHYPRPQLPNSLTVPSAPTVLPFHTFTCPLSAKDIRMISQRNALRISCSTLRASWMQGSVFSPPSPPAPHLNIGYVSSDFNNHPLAHL
jgi:tetratricopeptide (TPR) repeat protein